MDDRFNRWDNGTPLVSSGRWRQFTTDGHSWGRTEENSRADTPFGPLFVGSFNILSGGRVDYRGGKISYLLSIEILFSLGLLWGSRVRRGAR